MLWLLELKMEEITQDNGIDKSKVKKEIDKAFNSLNPLIEDANKEITEIKKIIEMGEVGFSHSLRGDDRAFKTLFFRLDKTLNFLDKCHRSLDSIKEHIQNMEVELGL